MTNLIPYSKQATVHLKDWTSFDVPEEKISAVFDVWQTKWVLWFAEPIDWMKWVDWAMISKIEEWFSKPDIKSLTKAQKWQLEVRKRKFYDWTLRDAPDEVIYIWVEKLKKWLTI